MPAARSTTEHPEHPEPRPPTPRWGSRRADRTAASRLARRRPPESRTSRRVPPSPGRRAGRGRSRPSPSRRSGWALWRRARSSRGRPGSPPPPSRRSRGRCWPAAHAARGPRSRRARARARPEASRPGRRRHRLRFDRGCSGREPATPAMTISRRWPFADAGSPIDELGAAARRRPSPRSSRGRQREPDGLPAAHKLPLRSGPIRRGRSLAGRVPGASARSGGCRPAIRPALRGRRTSAAAPARRVTYCRVTAYMPCAPHRVKALDVAGDRERARRRRSRSAASAAAARRRGRCRAPRPARAGPGVERAARSRTTSSAGSASRRGRRRSRRGRC